MGNKQRGLSKATNPGRQIQTISHVSTKHFGTICHNSCLYAGQTNAVSDLHEFEGALKGGMYLLGCWVQISTSFHQNRRLHLQETYVNMAQRTKSWKTEISIIQIISRGSKKWKLSSGDKRRTRLFQQNNACLCCVMAPLTAVVIIMGAKEEVRWLQSNKVHLGRRSRWMDVSTQQRTFTQRQKLFVSCF